MSVMGILIMALLVNGLFVGGLFWKMPDWSRPELLFGVTVPAATRAGEAGQAVIARYRRRVLVVTVIAVLAAWLPGLVGGERLAGATLLFSAVVLGQLVVITWAFLAARQEALPLAAAPSGRRVASVVAEDASMPGGWFWQSLPFVLFGGLIGALALAWPQIPDRFVTHWNGAMEPDAWSDKSLASVFGLPAIGLAVIATIPPLAWSLVHRTRRVHASGEAARIESERRHAVAVLLLWLEYAMLLTFAPLALMPFVDSPQAAKAMTATVLIAAIGGPIAMIAVWFARYGSALTTKARGAEAAADGAPIGDRTEDRHWKWGVIYYNPDDPVLWVEKRFGVGYTFNMARPSAWWLLGGMIGLPVLITVAVLVAA